MYQLRLVMEVTGEKFEGHVKNPPARSRDLPDGARKRLQISVGRGKHFSAKTLCF